MLRLNYTFLYIFRFDEALSFLDLRFGALKRIYRSTHKEVRHIFSGASIKSFRERDEEQKGALGGVKVFLPFDVSSNQISIENASLK